MQFSEIFDKIISWGRSFPVGLAPPQGNPGFTAAMAVPVKARSHRANAKAKKIFKNSLSRSLSLSVNGP